MSTFDDRLNKDIVKRVREEMKIGTELSDIKGRTAWKYDDEKLVDMAISSYGNNRLKYSKDESIKRVENLLNKKGVSGVKVFKIVTKVNMEMDGVDNG